MKRHPAESRKYVNDELALTQHTAFRVTLNGPEREKHHRRVLGLVEATVLAFLEHPGEQEQAEPGISHFSLESTAPMYLVLV